MHVHEVQRALRRLFSSPGTLVLSVTMLASAIGITTAMFTVVDALVLRPLPFHDPTSLTALAMGVKGGRGYMTTSSQAVLRAWKGSGAFEAVEAVIEEDAVIEHGGELVKKRAARITPQLLAMLGVEPLRGRSFVPGEGRTGTTDRILLSADLWHSLFNRDPQIIGRRIRVSGTLMEVVGILPAGFRFPSSTTVLWIPADFDAPPKDLEKAGVMVYARLKDRMPRQDILETADRAGRDSGALSDRLQTMLRPIAAGMVDPYATRAITALSIAVALAFAVLCLNGTNLMLTRFSLRQREFGVCSALGASRARLLREALIETAFLAMIAGIAGVLLANGLVALATRLLPEVFLSKTLTPIAISTRAVAATFVLTLVAAGIAGITPAWIATRVDPADSFRAVVRGTEARPRRRLSRALLVGEVALATTLLTGAALLVRTFVNLANAERGLNGDGVITGLVNLPAFAFKERPSRLAFAAALEDRLRQLPGVSHVSLSGGVPPGVAAFYFGDIRTLGEDPRTVSFS